MRPEGDVARLAVKLVETALRAEGSVPSDIL
jgi:hypothetical protein